VALRDDGAEIAVKKLRIKDDATAAKIAREVSVMQNLQHPNIVRLLGTSTDKRFLYILMELVSGNSLTSFISKWRERGHNLSEKTIRVYTRQLLEGLEYCHSRNIIHRDIKSQNILVESATGRLKIGDWGGAKQLLGKARRANGG